MISQDVVLVRYGEITLKDSWTRQSWERILAGNIAFYLQKAGVEYRSERGEGRIFVFTSDQRASEIISRVFGVVSASPASTVPSNLEEIARAAVDLAKQAAPKSFAIRPRRSGVSFSSEDIGRAVGEAVRVATGSKVNLSRPEMEIFVEARRERSFIFTRIVPGVGGLPLGSQGKMLALISGGIDSPVAAWLMMKRGCPVSLLHFDSRPYADAISQCRSSAEVLAEWSAGRKIDLITIPISRGIEKIAAHYPRATCILCRRLMYRIAGMVMAEEEAFGVVTGYSLGQVASQTPANIMAEQSGIDLPIYHPLIAMDKSEITDLARKIGTYRATADAGTCTAAPKRPMTRGRAEEVRGMEVELGLAGIAADLFSERVRTRL